MLRLGYGDDDEDNVDKEKSMPSLLQVCFWYRPRGSRLVDWRGTEQIWRDSTEQSTIVAASPSATAMEEDADSNGQPTLVDKVGSSLSPSSSAVSLASSVSIASSVSSVSSGAETPGSVLSKTTRYAKEDYGLVLADPQEQEEAKAWMERVTKAIHARIRARGKFMIDYAPLGTYLPIFFRVVLNPPTIREVDLVMLVEEILECGQEVGDSLPIPECCRC